ncbi:MAG: SEL1-like repeat protein [Alphaproteobacteria bacterium]|nr:SEL1-like repeat protein [Alphaproteobacteria bacterium]
MNNQFSTRFTFCFAMLASVPAWSMNMDCLQTEYKVKKHIALSLAKQVLPPMQGETLKTKSQKPDSKSQKTYAYDSWAEIEEDLVQKNSKENKNDCVVTDNDKRTQGSKLDIGAYSAFGTVYSTFQTSDGWSDTYVGPGTLVGPNLVLTGASSLYEKNSRNGQCIGKAKEVTFIPGMNEINKPFGKQRVTDFYFPEEYINSDNNMENYGLLILENSVGEEMGYLGISIAPPQQISSLEVDVGGYDQAEDKIYQMHGMKGKSTTVNEDFIEYEVDASVDHKGNGEGYQNAIRHTVYEEGKSYFIVSVEAGTGLKNQDTFLTKPRYEKIRGWIEDFIQKNTLKYLSDDFFSGVEVIDLSNSYIGDLGIPYLRQYASCLHTANLRNTRIADNGAEVLAMHPTIRKLNLIENYIGDKGAIALSHNTILSDLDVSYNYIGTEGGVALSLNNSLRSLNLNNNRIENGNIVLRSLAENTGLKTLRFSNPYLSARVSVLERVGNGVLRNNIGGWTAEKIDGNASIILGEAYLGSLIATGVGGLISLITANPLGVIGGAVAGNLATHFAVSTPVKHKFLIESEAAIALSKNSTLTELDLSDTYARGEAVSILLTSPSITSLNLSWNALNDEEAKIIARKLKKNEKVECLNLQNNNIKDQNIENFINAILARNKSLKELKTLREQRDFWKPMMEDALKFQQRQLEQHETDQKLLNNMLKLQKMMLEDHKVLENLKFKITQDADGLGLKDSPFGLVVVYAKGQRDLPKDEQKAAKLFRLAGDQGHKDAQFELGQIYLKNEKLEEATQWYRLAADQGHEDAQKILEQIQNKGESKKNQQLGGNISPVDF